MRMVPWGAAFLLCLGLAAPASAQWTFTFGGPAPRELQYKVVDTVTSVAPVGTSQTNNRTFSLANFLPQISPMSAKSILGYSQFPSPDGLPGKNYLKSFGFSRAQPIR